MGKYNKLFRGILAIVVALSLVPSISVAAIEPGDGEVLETLTSVKAGVTGPTVYNGVDYSRVYDCMFYSTKYPDLFEAFGADGAKYIEHFVLAGMKEGRQGSSGFDVNSYRNAYGDLRAVFGEDLPKYYTHYINSGAAEGRNLTTGVMDLRNPVFTYRGMDLSSVYDYNFYLGEYADVRENYANNDTKAIEHFVLFGCKEGRTGRANWDANAYGRLQNIAFNLASAGTVYLGTDLSGVYDYAYYAWNNPDVTDAVGYDPVMVIQHFATSGMSENREGRPGCDKGAYAGLLNAIKNTKPSTISFINKANGYSTPTDRIILVDKNIKQVCVLKGKKGSYAVEKVFSCATGASSSPTPNGVYNVGAKGRFFNTGTRGRCWYYTQIRGNYLFHSQIYDRQSKPVNLIDGSMGVAVSHGCIRMYLNDAKWIYDNVAKGTTIVIY